MMKRSPSKTPLSLLLIIAAIHLEAFEQMKKFHYVGEEKTWREARRYCKENYNDLASVSVEEIDQLDDFRNIRASDDAWIGLYRDPGNIFVWRWTGGSGDASSDTNWATLGNWARGQPNHDDCGSFSFPTNRWHSTRCSLRLPFICFVNTNPDPNPTTTPVNENENENPVRDPNLVLVKENKTWEQALEHCRDIGVDSSSRPDDHYGDHQYDLVSLQSEDDHRHARDRIQEATTNEVWTALRFLAGEWLWVDGEPQRYQNLPLCPAWGRHCGTLPKKDLTAQWQIRDCMERRNFLCIKSPA